jgi:hypothetical protein
LSNAGLSANDPNYLLPFTSAFDMQSMTTNQTAFESRLESDGRRGVLFEGKGEDRLRRRDVRPHSPTARATS